MSGRQGGRDRLLHHGVSGWEDIRRPCIPGRDARRTNKDVSVCSSGSGIDLNDWSADWLCRWHSAITTLGRFHRVNPKEVGLESFGKPSGFYNRQLKTFDAISKAQAAAVDKDTHEPVGKIPHQDDMVAFFSDPKTQPKDRSSFVHGDYKIDNLVFHKTEPRVIGILE
jgi:aminoglycoside phosphotransferase (APT) family kinase protein